MVKPNEQGYWEFVAMVSQSLVAKAITREDIGLLCQQPLPEKVSHANGFTFFRTITAPRVQVWASAQVVQHPAFNADKILASAVQSARQLERYWVSDSLEAVG